MLHLGQTTLILDAGRALLGLLVLCGLAWLLSGRRRSVFPWRVVLGGLGLQIGLAVLLLRVPVTAGLFEGFARLVTRAIGMAEAGSVFLFGSLADPAGPAGFVFAFRVLPVIVYFAAVMGVLYHLRVMPRVIAGMAWIMRRTLGVSGSEAVAVAANVLVGQTEAPLCVKPLLPRMTRSQLMVVMASGFATIAGSVFAGYVEFLGGDDEARRLLFARHLMTASLMSGSAMSALSRTTGSRIVTGLGISSGTWPGNTRLASEAISNIARKSPGYSRRIRPSSASAIRLHATY